MPRHLARLEGLDDVHAATAARAWRRQDARLVGVRLGRFGLGRRRRHGQQRAGDVIGAVAVGEQAIVADSVEAFWQDVQQEAPDDLARMQAHRLPALGPVVPEARILSDAVVLPAERDATVVG